MNKNPPHRLCACEGCRSTLSVTPVETPVGTLAVKGMTELLVSELSAGTPAERLDAPSLVDELAGVNEIPAPARHAVEAALHGAYRELCGGDGP